jgi:hypothetical protein
MGMARHVFQNLVRDLSKCGLGGSRNVTVEERVAIFLRLIIYGMGQRETQERFQRSADTVSKAFHRVLNAISGPPFYTHFVKLPDDEVPFVIQSDPKYAAFRDARACVDGSLEDAFVIEEDMSRYRSRKGRISQNILAACTFDMQLCYMMTGWEGSTADGRLWEEARKRDLDISPGRYWLADAGFPLSEYCMVPYRGKRYHLKEWAKSNQR